MMNEHEDEGFWLCKERADQMTDDQIGSYLLNKQIFDYGNSYEFLVARGEAAIRKFRKKIKGKTINNYNNE